MTDKLNGIELAKAMTNFVNPSHNNFDFVGQLLKEHRTLQQESFELMMDCIKAWAKAYERKDYDDRNEATCELCHKIYNQNGVCHIYENAK